MVAFLIGGEILINFTIFSLFVVAVNLLDPIDALNHLVLHSALPLLRHFPGELFDEVLFQGESYRAVVCADFILMELLEVIKLLL